MRVWKIVDIVIYTWKKEFSGRKYNNKKLYYWFLKIFKVPLIAIYFFNERLVFFIEDLGLYSIFKISLIFFVFLTILDFNSNPRYRSIFFNSPKSIYSHHSYSHCDRKKKWYLFIYIKKKGVICGLKISHIPKLST